MAYKVTTKTGKVYRASSVDHMPGFLKMQCWDGEHRLPAGDITYVKSTEVDEISRVILPIFVFSFIFFLIVILMLFA